MHMIMMTRNGSDKKGNEKHLHENDVVPTVYHLINTPVHILIIVGGD